MFHCVYVYIACIAELYIIVYHYTLDKTLLRHIMYCNIIQCIILIYFADIKLPATISRLPPPPAQKMAYWVQYTHSLTGRPLAPPAVDAVLTLLLRVKMRDLPSRFPQWFLDVPAVCGAGGWPRLRASAQSVAMHVRT